MVVSERCMNCMSETGGAAVCPQCGFDERTAPVSPLYLPLHTVLQGRYMVGRVLGEGGFGITYLGWDHTLAIRVAIKEFLPRELAARGADGRTISAYRGDLGEAFLYGLEKFLEEARVLARFAEHQGIVAVRDFFPAHGTGYLVMSYLEGLTLKDYLAQQGGRIPFKPALAILMPVMDALRAVHEVGLLHRDISPDNIFITRDRQVKLIDFGAARAALGAHSRSLSVILKPGYAPPEQYGTQGRQGPWTDVYAVGATCYQMLIGQMPPEAPDRLYQDTLKPPTAYGADLPQTAELALFKALAVRVEQRFQSVADLQAALVQAAQGQTAAPPVTPSKPPAPKPPEPARPQPSGSSGFDKREKWMVAAAGIGVVGVLLLVQNLSKSPTPPVSTRAAQPQSPKPLIGGRYLDNSDGTVTDTQTGRQWMRCSLGQTWQSNTCMGKANVYGWQAVESYAMGFTGKISYAGQQDWRVPTIEELHTLIYCSSGQPKTWNDTGKSCEGDYGRPTIYQSAFPNTPDDRFWTSSPHPRVVGSAWSVHFYNGNDYAGNSSYAVRLVRGGQ